MADLSFGQSFNPYSYVNNNPLTYADPSGFTGEPEKPPILPIRTEVSTGPGGVVDVVLLYPPRDGRPKDSSEQVGAAVPATDTDTTGSTPPGTGPPEPPELSEPPEPDGWIQNPYVQTIGGFLGGIGLGVVPFAAAGQQVLDEGGVLPHGTPEARRGLAVGQVVGGIFTLVGGLAGEVLGGVATVTGLGAVVGVPAIVVSTTLVVGGAANVMAGLRGLSQSMMSSGSGAGKASTPRVANRGQRESSLDRSKGADGVEKCTYCGTLLDRKSGMPNSAEIDHQKPYAKGGGTVDSNLNAACRTCNRSKGSKELGTEWVPPKDRQR